MEEDGFYQKLNKLNESSGLSILFNFRETSIDLHQFYKTVTEKGGYHQVTQDGKWEDVACGLNQENRVSLSATQLQKLYATFLYPFEQTYYYRCSIKHDKTRKRNDVALGVCKLSPTVGIVNPSLIPAISVHCSRKPTAEMEDDDFYQKLNKLNESFGLSILFNFRETSIDLHQFYETVTQKGGYRQVTKDGKWEDVASSLNQESRVSLTATQLQKLYATILYPFEQTYYYRCPTKHDKTQKRNDVALESRDLNNFTEMRKQDDELYLTQYQFNSMKTEHHHAIRKFSSARKEPCVPLGSRNCYQMFLKMECERLKRTHGDTSFVQLQDMIETWKHLPSEYKQPYIEASKKDKKRFLREMAAYEEHKRKQRNQHHITTKKAVKFSSPKLDFTTSSEEAADNSHLISCQDVENHKVVDLGTTQFDGDYHVALQPDDCDEIALVTDESTVEMAVRLMKKARPNDPIFEIDWDAYGGLIDISYN